MGLFFRHCRNEGERHRRILVKGEDCLRLEKYANGGLPFGKLTNNTYEVILVSCKTGYALRNDKSELARFGIGNHLLESLTVLKGCTADTLVCINLDESPIGVVGDILFVVFFLKLERGRLPHILGGYTNINTDKLRSFDIVKICLLLFGYVLIIFGIDFHTHTTADFFLLLVFAIAFFNVNHHCLLLLHQAFLLPGAARRKNLVGLLGSSEQG